uniref:Protein translation factor SUI1 homolog n=2 Tax=Triticum TaxID=4564 RepID=A0A8R7K257_TRIUA
MYMSSAYIFSDMVSSFVDPFAEANAEDAGAGPGAKDYVHVRIQQRNGRKSLTTVQGLKKEFSYNKILKDLKKEFCCNGTVVQDPELGQVIQLQGDQRKNVATFLVQVSSTSNKMNTIHHSVNVSVHNHLSPFSSARLGLRRRSSSRSTASKPKPPPIN